MLVPTTIANIKRLQNSPDGNPSWGIVTRDGMAYRTKPNAAVVYVLSEASVGKRGMLTIERGQIVGWEESPSCTSPSPSP